MVRATVGIALVLTGCGPARDPELAGVDVTGCQPVDYGSVVGLTLHADAPSLDDGSRYRCLVFPGTAEHQVQLTVFAEGFRPAVFLFDPADPNRILAWSDSGPGSGVARISATLPHTTLYAAVVTTHVEKDGTFLISVQDPP